LADKVAKYITNNGGNENCTKSCILHYMILAFSYKMYMIMRKRCM